MKISIAQLDESFDYQLICQGNTAEVFLCGDKKILKLFRDSFPYEIIEAEFKVSCKIAADLPFAPKTFELIKYKNRYGILYEKINGKDMVAIMLKKSYKLSYFSKYLAQIHMQIHKYSTDLNLDLKAKLSENIISAVDLAQYEKERILAYLKTLPDGKSLCHFDFHPGNVMLANNNFYVIDWMTACNGCEIADVARTYLLLLYGELPHVNSFVRFLAHIIEKHIGKIYLRQYKKLTGITDAEIKQWLLPIAAARLIEWIPQNEKIKLLKLIRKELKA